MERAPQPEPFLRGCAWPAGEGVSYPRCDPGPPALRLPADTRAAAALPVGVRFEFVGDADAIEVRYRTETDDFGYRGPAAGRSFVTFCGDQRVDEADAILGEGKVTLATGPGDAVRTLYLPEGMRPTVLELKASSGSIRPAPSRPRWLCYGDSIAEGWCASEPAAAWPHVLAREEALDVVNLGYAGAARGEVASAEEIAALPADLITISHGTNCWTRTPHSIELFVAGLRAFLDLVRLAHAEVPIVAISPLLREDAENTENRLGATLAALREGFESVIHERRAHGDPSLTLVPGLELIVAGHLPDGIHPDDAGHERIARALAPVLTHALGERA
jgi:lysophospholipase L1-like esterase